MENKQINWLEGTHNVNEKGHNTANVSHHSIWRKNESISKNFNGKFKSHRYNKHILTNLKNIYG